MNRYRIEIEEKDIIKTKEVDKEGNHISIYYNKRGLTAILHLLIDRQIESFIHIYI